MPIASGSIAFLGAARFQGYWDATHNEGTGSAVLAKPGPYTDPGSYPSLFTAGTSANGGYHSSIGITASIGDYWQVTGSGTYNVDGVTSWNLNDWCIYSGSAAGAAGKWTRLAFEDTIASIVIGDLSATSFHIGAGNDRHIIFASGSVHSGQAISHLTMTATDCS